MTQTFERKPPTNLLAIDGDDAGENGPGDNLATWGSGQTTGIGEVVASIDGLDELSQVDVPDERRIWLSGALNSLCSKLKVLQDNLQRRKCYF